MFLFTTPPEPPVAPSPPAIVRSVEPAIPANAPAPVVSAIRQGADRTGTDFGYLLSTARRESALDPSAKAPTSSATGLFQFIEQTWLGLIKSEGEKVGLSRYAEAISPRQGGGFTVDDTGTKSEILKLREDPALASVMAGTLTQQNRDALSAATGREPNPAELYMAHLLGARGAADLIRTAQNNPGRAAALDLPEAAAANRSIFYERDGRPRGAGEVYALISAPQGAASGTPAAVPAPPGAPTTLATTTAADPPLFKPDGPVLYSLFQTENRPGPVSASLAKIWRANAARSEGASTVAFFPSSTGASSAVNREAPAVAATPTAATSTVAAAVPTLIPPLPPIRPVLAEAAAPARRIAHSRAARLASR